MSGSADEPYTSSRGSPANVHWLRRLRRLEMIERHRKPARGVRCPERGGVPARIDGEDVREVRSAQLAVESLVVCDERRIAGADVEREEQGGTPNLLRELRGED